MRSVLYMLLSAEFFASFCIWTRMIVEFNHKCDLIPAALSLIVAFGCLYASYQFA